MLPPWYGLVRDDDADALQLLGRGLGLGHTGRIKAQTKAQIKAQIRASISTQLH